MANTARKTVIAEVTAALDTFRDAAISGSDGNRMLVASVPVAANAASTAICTKVEEASRGAAASVETVWSVMKVPGWLHDMYHIKPGRERRICTDAVIAGLDPAIHRIRKKTFGEDDGWPGQARP